MDTLNSCRHRFPQALHVLTFALFSVAVHAESNTTSTDYLSLSIEQLLELKVVVDVASFYDESELDAGSTVNILTRQNARRLGARTVPDVLNTFPAMLLAPSFFGNSALSIRGYTSSASDNGIQMQIDGIPINSFILGSRLHDIYALQLGVMDKIEVIRGPGSTLYGADAFHGVVSFSTFESNEDLKAFDTELGERQFQQHSIRVSQTVFKDWRLDSSFALSVQPEQNIEYRYTDSDNTTQISQRENQYQAHMGVIKLRSPEHEKVSTQFGIYLREQDLTGFPGASRLFSDTMQDNDTGEIDTEVGMLSATVKVKFDNDISLSIKNYAWEDEFTRKANSDLPNAMLSEQHTGSIIHLKGPKDNSRTQWAAGLEYAYMKVVDAQSDGEREMVYGHKRQLYSTTFQARTRIIDETLDLLYGARYDDYSDAKHHVSPRAGIIYHPTRKSAFKLLYGHAYRPPTAAELEGSSVATASDGTAENVDTFELAFIHHANHCRSSITLFKSHWQDAVLLEANPDSPPPLARLNIGENKAEGVEISFNWIADPVRFDFSGSYVTSSDTISDSDYVAFPKYIFNAGIGVSTLNKRMQLYLHNRVHLDAYDGPITDIVPMPQSLKNYWRSDFSLIWKGRQNHVDVFFNLLNVMDRKNYFPSPASAEGGIPDIERTASVGLRLNF
ncbi:Colicin I receptor [Thalassocella blandensis]|nr:Colicin I receptor [Thalassocella blandensis]